MMFFGSLICGGCLCASQITALFSVFRQLQLQRDTLLRGEQDAGKESHQRLPAVQPQSSESNLPKRSACGVLQLWPLPTVGCWLSHGGSQLPDCRYSVLSEPNERTTVEENVGELIQYSCLSIHFCVLEIGYTSSICDSVTCAQWNSPLDKRQWQSII